MKNPLWQRGQRRSGEDAPTENEGPTSASDVMDRLHRPSAAPPVSSERSEAYAAWADRLKTHKRDKLKDLLEPEPAPSGPSAHWNPEQLFSGPDDPPVPAARRSTTELLQVLQLGPGAAPTEVRAAYRRLAKEHHPDRWAATPDDVRSAHEDSMAEIAAAYNALTARSRR